MEHGLRRGDDDDESVSTSAGWTRSGTGRPAELDEIVALDVVHLDVAVEAAGELGETRLSSSRCPGRRASPPATRSVW